MGRLYEIIKETIRFREIKEITVTGTTNAQGALRIQDIPKENTIIGMSCSNNVNAKLSAWLYNGTDWYVQAVRWDTGAYVANTSISVTIRYLKPNPGGGTA